MFGKIIISFVSLFFLTHTLFADTLCPSSIDPSRVLVINDLSVVESHIAMPLGNAGFATVMQKLSPNTSKTEDFIKTWLAEWHKDRLDADRLVQQRTPGLLTGIWPLNSDDSLDLAKSPFHLSAIVYRPDLVSDKTPAGEFRLVYNAYHPHTGDPIDFSVIFEFRLPDDLSPQTWAQQFVALSQMSFGSEYNNKLSEILSIVLNSPKNLAQLRTNDFYLGPEWELREFKITRDNLALHPVERTPNLVYNYDIENDFISWVVANKDLILAKKHVIPEKYLGGSAVLPDDSFRWFKDNPQLTPELRHALAVETCNGCHGGETRTRFQHVLPRRDGEKAEISKFLIDELPLRMRAMRKLACGTPQ
jgi:hypothetical protein